MGEGGTKGRVIIMMIFYETDIFGAPPRHLVPYAQSNFLVPLFVVVPGQRDELIVGSKTIRPIIQNMKSTDK